MALEGCKGAHMKAWFFLLVSILSMLSTASVFAAETAS